MDNHRSLVPLAIAVVVFFAILGAGVGMVWDTFSGGDDRETVASETTDPATVAATPTEEPGTGEGASPSEAATDAASETPEASPTPEETTPAPGEIVATPGAATAGQNERVSINGSYPGAQQGTPVAVQRQEGGAWTDFPATANIGGDGNFSLWVASGRTGENVWRIVDPATGAASAPFTVTIG